MIMKNKKKILVVKIYNKMCHTVITYYNYIIVNYF